MISHILIKCATLKNGFKHLNDKVIQLYEFKHKKTQVVNALFLKHLSHGMLQFIVAMSVKTAEDC